MTTTQGGKKSSKKMPAADKPAVRKKVTVRSKTSDITPKISRPSSNERQPESLAMIAHVHGDKVKVKKNRYMALTRMSDIVEANWSLWHLSWAILWRMVLLVVVLRFFAVLTVSIFSNMILAS